MQLTIPETSHYAQSAGFQGKSLSTIVAIAQAESGLDTHATNTHTSVGVDRGILQINSYFWPGCSDSCAYDPACAFDYAYKVISSGGQDFGKWVTYTSGAYKRYYNQNLATASVPFNTTHPSLGKRATPYPAYGGTPWYAFPHQYWTHGSGGSETGDDIATPVGTPITAIFPGTIVDISGGPPGGTHASGTSSVGQAAGYGWSIAWKLDKPWQGAPWEYVQHLDAVNPYLKVGTHIDSGTLLGWTGGEYTFGQAAGHENPLGVHTLDIFPTHTAGPHTEVGFFTQLFNYNPSTTPDPIGAINMAAAQHLPYGTADVFGTGAGDNSGIDMLSQQGGFSTFSIVSRQNINVLQQGWPFWPFGGNAADYDAFSEAIHKTLVQYPGFYGICLALDEAEQFPGLYQSYGPQDVLPWNLTQDTWRSIVGTAVGNTMPLAIRGTLVVFGIFLLLALFWQLVKPSIDVLPDFIGAAA